MMKFVLVVVTVLELTYACRSPPSPPPTQPPPSCSLPHFHNTTGGCFYIANHNVTSNVANRLCQGLGDHTYLAVLDTLDVSTLILFQNVTNDRTIFVVPLFCQ